ncbi:preprotein translocase subunit SecG [Kerstersia similis]|uniref:preprotein translocase subunit SecG n=1 Tax=Kerstersia similis TaxID=206505 RepID=UPI0039EFC12A
MSSIYTLLLVVQIISAFTIIGLVLMQHGKGADMGSSFGSGSAGSLFGATGAANFLSRTTKWAAVLFFAVTTGLAYFSYAPSRAKEKVEESGVMQGYQDLSVPQLGDTPVNNAGGAAAVPSAPVTPAVPEAAVPAVSVPVAPVAPAAEAAPQQEANEVESAPVAETQAPAPVTPASEPEVESQAADTQPEAAAQQ